MSVGTIPQLLAERSATAPDAPFLVCEDIEFTWAQTHDLVARLAARLQSRGLVAGDHVLILSNNCATSVLAWFSANHLGAVAVPVNPASPENALAAVVRLCEPRLIIIEGSVLAQRGAELDRIARDTTRLVFRNDEDLVRQCEGARPSAPAPGIGPGTPATVLFTSGTTGEPKGVVNSHGVYLACGRETAKAMGIRPVDRLMIVLPLFHANPQMYAVMSCLATGAALIVRPRFSATSFFADARRFKATGMTFVGTLLAMLCARTDGAATDHDIRFAVGGGATPEVWSDVEARFGIRVHELYGMTEVGGWVTANTIHSHRFGTCGQVRQDMLVEVVDPGDHPVAPGVRGEIVVRPKEPFVILSGYLRNPSALADALRNLWFHTGDIGSFDEDGFLSFHGRLKDMIRRGGENLSPTAIEEILVTHPAIEELAIVGVDDPIFGEEIKAVVVLKGALTAEEFHRHATEALPAYMRPRYLRISDSLPKTETQKTRRSELRTNDAATIDLHGLK